MTDQPGYTRVPNALLEVLATLPEAECRVVLAIVRKTAGWQKECDVISYSQLEAATNMSRQGVINGVEAAIKRGILIRTASGKNNGFCYQVVNEVDHLKQSTKQTSQRSRPQVVNEVDHQVVNEVDPQKKDSKEKKESITASRETREPSPPKKARAPKADTTPAPIREAIADACAADSGRMLARVNKAAKAIWQRQQANGKTEEQTVAAVPIVAAYLRRTVYPFTEGQPLTPEAFDDRWKQAAEDERKRRRANGANGTHAPAASALASLSPADVASGDEVARAFRAARGGR